MHAMTCCWRAASQEFSDCLVAEGDRMKCGDLREDYMECLHHGKEVRAAPRAAETRAAHHCPPALPHAARRSPALRALRRVPTPRPACARPPSRGAAPLARRER